MMTETTPALDTWGIVELMGHQKTAGKLSEQSLAGANMLRVDVPALAATRYSPATEPFTKYYSSSAIYAITPTSEAVARAAAAQVRPEAIAIYGLDLVSKEQAALAQTTAAENHDEEAPEMVRVVHIEIMGEGTLTLSKQQFEEFGEEGVRETYGQTGTIRHDVMTRAEFDAVPEWA
jgi:hypothetical protein